MIGLGSSGLAHIIRAVLPIEFLVVKPWVCDTCLSWWLCIIGTLIFLHYDNKRMERELQQSDYASLCGVAGEWAHEATFIRNGVCRIKPYTNLGDIRMTDWHNGR